MLPQTFVLFLVSLSVQGMEPECSRFHYEEQTLEKMIRQEIRVERMKSEISETRKQTESALEGLQRERDSFKVEIETIRKTQDMERETFLRELNEAKGKLLIPGIGFQAKVLKNTKLSTGETLIFMNFDIGNGYNNQTGLFTATKSGLYLFGLHLCINAVNANMYYEVFTQDGVALNGRFVAGSGSYYPCHYSQVLVYMQHGDAVGVRMKDNSFSSGNIVIWESAGLVESVLSGVLVNTNV